MWSVGSLNSYIQQTLIYPWVMHDVNKPIRGLVNLKVVLFGVLILLTVMLIKRINFFRFKYSQSMIITISLFMSFLMIGIAFEFRDLGTPFVSLNGSLESNLLNFFKNSPYGVLFGILLILFVLNYLSRKQKKLTCEEKFQSSLSMIFMVQLYPNPEPAHIWYVIPVVLVGIAILIAKFFDEVNLYSIVALVMVPTIASVYLISVQVAKQPRISYAEAPITGMLGNENSVNRIDNTLRELRVTLNGDSFQNNCTRGLYSVPGNFYRASDYQHQNLDYKFFLPKKESKFIFECDIPESRMVFLSKNFTLAFAIPGELPGQLNVLYYSKS